MNARILLIGLPLAILANAGPYSFRSVESCASCESEAVFGINNSGALAGLVFDATGPRAFFGSPGAFNLFSLPGAAFTEAVDITQSGVVSGDYLDASGTLRVFVRETDGTLKTLPMIPGAGAMSGGKMNRMGTLIGNYAADPMASTGANAFVMTGLALDFTFSAHGGFITQALGIKRAGTIVGFYLTPAFGPPQSFIRAPNGSFAMFSVPGAIGTSLFDINNNGDLAGSYVDGDGLEPGFILRNGELTTLDYTGPNTTVWA